MVAGRASIVTPSGTSLVVNQTSPGAIINWGSFSIGQGNAVAFNNGAGSTLNRVTGNVPSRIDGTLTATGSVYLINPAGVAVGTTGRIATGGSFVASTLDIANEDFLDGGEMRFAGTSKAAVVNAGTIGSLGGDVALIAREVENTGDISAPNGTAGLAAGYEVLVRDGNLDGGRFQVKVGGADTQAKTSGRIRAAAAELRANGGNVYALAGNTTGVIAATGTAKKGGRIFLTVGDGGTAEVGGTIAATRKSARGATQGGDIRVSGGTAKVSGTLSARGSGSKVSGAKGGTVVVAAKAITLTDTAVVDVSGPTGGAILIGGDYQGGKDAATKVLPEAVATATTTTVAAGAKLSADGTAGNGGRVVVWSDDLTTFQGTITARGAGAGNGGDAEVSGKAVLAFDGTVDLTAEAGSVGTLLLDPYNLTISTGTDSNVTGASPFSPTDDNSVLNVTTLTDALASANIIVTTGTSADPGLQAGDITIAAPVSWSANTRLTLAAAGNVVFNAPVTATGASAGLVIQYGPGKDYIVHAPITLSGAVATLQIGADGYTLLHDMAAIDAIDDTNSAGRYALAQSLDASGTTYDHALVGPNGESFRGTFAGLGNTISNLTIEIDGHDTLAVAGLFGQTASTAVIRDISLLGGSVTGTRYTGGLVGQNLGRITNAYATGDVTSNGSPLGGLVGYNGNSGIITNAYATGDVTSSFGLAGGFVGQNLGSISNAYATGNVRGSSSSTGGFVGENNNAGHITNAYATGTVTGSSTNIGGFAGYNNTSASIAASFWDTITSGRLNAVGGGDGSASISPLDASRAYTQATYTGWDFTNTWYLVNGETRPFLRWEWSATVSNAHQLQLMAMNPAASYALAANLDLGLDLGNAASMWKTATAFPVGNGFVPVGAFTGTFDGAGHTIANLTIKRTSDNVGLFGTANGAVIRDVGLVGVNVSGHDSVGGLVGSSTGGTLVERSYVTTGTITGTNFNAGGLVGNNDHSTINQSYAGAAVHGFRYAGGLVGVNNGGTVSQSYATGDVTGTQTITGGLVGYNYSGTVTQSYATGDVSGNTVVGGLVGQNNNAAGVVYQSYSTGAVSGTSEVGGLVGNNNGASVTDSYWDTDTSHRLNGIGSGSIADATGLTTAQFQDTAGFMAMASAAGWNFDTTWAPPSTGYYPELYALTPVAWVKAIDAASTYGDSTAAVSAATTAGGPAAYVFGPSNDSLTVTDSTVAVDPTTNAGAHTTGLTTRNVTTPSTGGVAYRVFYFGANTLTVDRAALTITATSLTKAYGETATLTYTSSSLQNGETIGSVSLASAGVGGSPYVIAASNAAGGTFDPDNYDITYEAGALTVNPAALTITATNLTKTYGQTAALANISSGLQNGETIGSVILSSAGAAATAGVSGGPYAITASNAAGGTFDAANYDIDYVDGALTVNRAALTITAANASKTYGQVATLTESTVAGLQNGETIGSVSLSSAGAAATASVSGGPYAIVASNASGGTFDAANYDITYVNGLLTVMPRPLTVAADDQAMTAGAAVPVLGWTVSAGSLVNGDGLAGVLSTEATSASPAGLYPILQGTLTASANYALTYMPGVLSIEAVAAPSNGGGLPSPEEIAALTLLMPGQFVQTTAPNALVQFAGSDRGENMNQPPSDDCVGDTIKAACIGQPHPDNRSYGRFLHFSGTP